MSQVSIVQKWNGVSKVSLDLLYCRFLAYLVDQGSKVIRHNDVNNNDKLFLSDNDIPEFITQKNSRLLENNKSISWINQLLQTPLPEHRKYCIWRILAPYLINIKHLPFNEAFDIMDKWLCECDVLKPFIFALDFRVMIYYTTFQKRGSCKNVFPE